VLGFLAGAIASLPFVGASQAYQYFTDRRHGRPRSYTITDDGNPQAWRLCDLAWRTAQTESWSNRTVDPQRKLAAVVWSAVERITAIERQRSDARRALEHESLRALAEETLARIEREQRSLDAIESNVEKVFAAADRIDVARALAAREREVRELRLAEERELLGRLTGDPYGRPTGAQTSDHAADRSAGMAAEAEAVAGWLAESDRMLRDL
jgi:hypothetical protein